VIMTIMYAPECYYDGGDYCLLLETATFAITIMFPECNFDSGDCCGSCVNKQFFSFRIRCGIANSWNESGNGFVINNETISLLQLS
jgi:hypothetical protein